MGLAKLLRLLFTLSLVSCSVSYNFTGSSVPDAATSIYIGQVLNLSAGGPSSLPQDFTEELREYFQRNTNLTVETKPVAGELSLQGNITKYEIRNVAPQTTSDGQESAAINRLTVTVQMNYINPYNSEDDFSESFSFPADFQADVSLNEVEDQLLEEIKEQLILKIFNRCFGNW